MSKRVTLTNGKDFIEVFESDMPSMEKKGWKLPVLKKKAVKPNPTEITIENKEE
tara:strand:- start:3370 stop:3531 length:162 start_codon:yes stop_codon:yes gene_type:complete